MLDLVDLPVSDHDVRGPRDDRLDQIGDALLGVLVVAVGVDEDVGSELEGASNAVVEGAAQALVARVVHELPDAVGPAPPRRSDRSIRRR